MITREPVPLVVVIVLNWNRREDTLTCLRSVTGVTYPNFRVVVVDNGSVDGSAEAVAAEFPEAEIIANAENLGYARGCNQGLRWALAAGAEYVFLLNNDAVVAPDILDVLVYAARRHPSAGLLGPKILDATGRYIWSVGGHRRWLTMDPRDDARGEPDGGQYDRCRRVDYLLGAGLLIRRQVLETVGLFDPRFFFFYEDHDLCIRAQRAGYGLLCVPQAVIWHQGSASTGGRESPLHKYHLARSSVHYYRKHIPRSRWPLIVLYRLGSAGRHVWRSVRRGQWPAAWAYVRGLITGVWESPRSGELKGNY